MKVNEAIRKRRSIRKFKKRDVNKSIIDKILKSALCAPSSKNCQPWHFLILKGKDKDKIAEITEKKFKEPDWIKSSTTLNSCRAVREAPVLILVFNKAPLSQGENKIKRNTKRLSSLLAETLSIGACIQNMLLTATSYNLGSLWIGDLRNAKESIQKHLKIKYDLIAGVVIGYSN